MAKGLDACFLHYGIKQEDMGIIEQICKTSGIDLDWFKENVLKPYNQERNNENLSEKRLNSILKQALSKLPQVV